MDPASLAPATVLPSRQQPHERAAIQDRRQRRRVHRQYSLLPANVPGRASSNAFWVYVERVYLHGVINGIPVRRLGEPCPGTYFRPGSNVTRGQTSKIVANTFYPNCQPRPTATPTQGAPLPTNTRPPSFANPHSVPTQLPALQPRRGYSRRYPMYAVAMTISSRQSRCALLRSRTAAVNPVTPIEERRDQRGQDQLWHHSPLSSFILDDGSQETQHRPE